MKELIKPLKNEKEYNDAHMYCEGGNTGFTDCTTSVSCSYVSVKNSENAYCTGWSISENNENELLF